MFTDYPTYDPYRPLTYKKPREGQPPPPLQRGEDVYALQRSINAILHLDGDAALKPDGALGPITGAKIGDVQVAVSVGKDGVAGPVTQRAIALLFLDAVADADLYLVEKGQLQRESLYLLGNYSPKRVDPAAPVGWSFDAGVTEMNSAHYDVKTAFEPQVAIGILVQQTRDAYKAYANTARFVGADQSDHRRWQLAAGHWNAPAYAQWLAGFRDGSEKEPGPTARQRLETYMADATVYLN